MVNPIQKLPKPTHLEPQVLAQLDLVRLQVSDQERWGGGKSIHLEPQVPAHLDLVRLQVSDKEGWGDGKSIHLKPQVLALRIWYVFR